MSGWRPALLVHADGPVKSFADLNGRTIMAEPGSIWLDYLRLRYGINFHLIPLNFGIAEFMADRNFVQQCFVTSEPYYVLKNGGHPRALLIASAGYDPYRVVFAMRGFAREHPDAVRAFMAASLRGWRDFIDGDPAPGKALIEEGNREMTSAFIDYSIGAMRRYHIVEGYPERGERLGLMTRRRLEEQAALLARLKITPAPLPLGAFARFDLLPPDLREAAGR